MRTLTPDVAAALPGPTWLRDRRQAAAERFEKTSTPSAELELWRYSRIDQLDLDTYSPEQVTAAPPDLGEMPVPTERGGLAVLGNGHLVSCELDDVWAGRGVRFGRLADLDGDGSFLGSVLGDPGDIFDLANDAFGAEPLLLHVPAGVRVSQPLVVVEWTDAEGSAVFPRLVVRAEGGSEVTVVHLQRSAEVRCFVAPVVELSAGDGARIAYLCDQDVGSKTWQTASVTAEGAQQSHVTVAAAAFGGDYARVRTDCRLVGRGATGKLAALYFADGDQMLDFRTFQDHRAPDCTSDLLFKGVIDDRAHSVYSGMIRVRPHAKGTNAFQTNRNIKLSDQAWAESVPNLEIENNDVRCSHASTVGPIDDEQRFYLESRGVPAGVAERLIVAGFFAEVIDLLPAPAVRADVAARIARRLAAL